MTCRQPRQLMALLCCFSVSSIPVAADVKGVEVGPVLEEVVVTAQKRVQNLFDVPVSVTALSADDIDRLFATTVEDYAAYVPGLNFTSLGGPGQGRLTLRGLSAMGVSASVATYIDEMNVTPSSMYGGGNALMVDLFPYDIERIEVVRGPQGTLYGGNALGGLLKYVTRRPSLDAFSAHFGGDARFVAHGDDPGYGVRGHVNAVAIPGELGVTASGFYQKSPGYIDNANTGKDDVNKASQQGGRLAVLWQPDDRSSVYLSALTQDVEIEDLNVAWYGFYDSSKPVVGELDSLFSLPQTRDRTLDYVSAIVEVDLGWGDLTSVTSYSSVDSESIWDYTPSTGAFIPLFTGGAVTEGLAPLYLDNTNERFTQELRLASYGESRFDWIVGAYYVDERTEQYTDLKLHTLDGAEIPGIKPVYLLALESDYEEFAVFGTGTLHVNERLDVVAGIRWTDNEEVFEQTSDGVTLPNEIYNVGRSSESVATYMLSTPYHVNDDLMVYARYATGYRPGGPNAALPGVPAQADADNLDSYELGVKTNFFNRRATVEVAAFHSDWSDIQTNVRRQDGIGYVINSDSAEVDGLEFTLSALASAALRVDINFAYTDAKFSANSPALGAVEGDSLPEVPKWQGAVTVAYEYKLWGKYVGTLGGGWRYLGSQPVYNPNVLVGQSEVESYELLDLYAGIAGDRWKLNLFAKNVLDDAAQLSNQREIDTVRAMPLFTAAGIARPLSIGLSVDFQI
ncbi:TonB-dependent receptor [Parahaliea mediterranea]|uniref:TonB-dependent receptor n=1 Tax=Parahaliea mediterranea TaxID=651086 RepID=A0A939DE19_9GAMM|nr:TonB-dependent receptor [Parahaliea mediterranea]MBN7796550.1 TonB-dependent receptor [Parahaliea mediterranea]